MIKNVLFDLDGTLLPMDMGVFVEGYLKLLAGFMAKRGTDPGKLIKAVWAGTDAMVKNDGSRSNVDVFWDVYGSICPIRPGDREATDVFYATEFQKARQFCGFSPQAAGTVGALRDMGLRAALATNPVFPRPATLSRVGWAGLEPGDFELITTYENSRFCKPNPEYYRDVCLSLDLDPAQTLMVGNDTQEDAAASKLGMSVFIVTHSLIDRRGDIDRWPHGGFDELVDYIKIHA